MRLDRFEIVDETRAEGLSKISMEKLGQVVALFGRNGAGKSRILREVNSALLNIDDIEGPYLLGKVWDTQKKIKETERRLDKLKLLYDNKEALRQNAPRMTLKEHNSRVREDIERGEAILERELEREKRDLAYNRHEARASHYFRTAPNGPILHTHIAFSEPQLPLLNAYKYEEVSRAIRNFVGTLDLTESSRHVTALLHRLSKAAHLKERAGEDDKQTMREATLFCEAQRVVSTLMDSDLGFKVVESDAVPTLDGLPLQINHLSQGQKILLAYSCYLLHPLLQDHIGMTKVTLRGSIVLIDEPEHHLHPSAVVMLVSSLREIVGEDGQIWLATHSTTLLPHLDKSEIWMVKDGDVLPPSIERAHQVLELLIGSEDNLPKLLEFVQEPHQWAANKFSAECLVAPEKVGFVTDDPQLFQITQSIADVLDRGQKCKIMDFGAGKGRLALGLADAMEPEKRNHIEYCAIEPDETCHADIIESAQTFGYAVVCARDIGEITHNHKGTFTAVVMCNVLHEIRPTKWVSLLTQILEMLSETGSIIICEDLFLPTGELPHELGFLVLNQAELEVLFSLNAPPKCMKHPEERYEGRLTCVEIPKSEASVTPESVHSAISSLKSRAKAQIEMLRADEGGARAGRQYALYCQLFVNSELALEELQIPSPAVN